MFCPKCGSADQTEKTYCRRCGNYLPDLTQPVPTAPEVHVKANLALGVLTVLTSFTVALLLYIFFLGRGDTPPVIYVMFGLSIAMGAWHVQTTLRSKTLWDHFRQLKLEKEQYQRPALFIPADRSRLISEQRFEQFQAGSVNDSTTSKFELASRSERNT